MNLCPHVVSSDNKSCLASCPEKAQYSQIETKVCKSSCDSDSYYPETGTQCVSECPNYISNDTKNCVKNCSDIS